MMKKMICQVMSFVLVLSLVAFSPMMGTTKSEAKSHRLKMYALPTVKNIKIIISKGKKASYYKIYRAKVSKKSYKRLYEYGFNNYRNYLILNKDNIKIKSKRYKRLYIKNNYYYLMNNNERDNINTSIKLYKIIKKERIQNRNFWNNK